MSEAARRLLAEALALSPDERAELAEELEASLPAEAAAAWEEEIARRVAALDRGEAVVLDLADATRALRAKHGG